MHHRFRARPLAGLERKADQVAIEVLRAERRLTVRVNVAERDSDIGKLADLVTPQNTIHEIGVYGIDLIYEDRLRIVFASGEVTEVAVPSAECTAKLSV